jgi:hypothetical protein
MSECLSYYNILQDIKKFKKSGTISIDGDSDFNMFDTPSHKYFKILFYFGSSSEFYNASEGGSGLLAPTWEIRDLIQAKQNDKNYSTFYYDYNSAWAYLKLNNENERAEKLEQFVTLLSDISTYSPWYFTSVSGIQEALTRVYPDEGKLEMTDKKLTINCLPDAYDNRIGTLLDLYRDITWSWVHKKEIIPANLRKFDMAIYIFESPVNNLHKSSDIIGSENRDSYKVSYKMIEFHDCEFKYNSAASAWSELNNETGFSPKYTIEISYADAYEISYNEIMMRKIGDVILTDLVNSDSNHVRDFKDYQSNPQKDSLRQKIEFKARTQSGGGFLTNAIGQVAGHFVKDVKSLFNRAVLGNLHTYSLTKISDQLKDIAKGNLIKTGYSIADYIKSEQHRRSINSKQKPKGDIFPDVDVTKSKPTGNIFNKSTLANNI